MHHRYLWIGDVVDSNPASLQVRGLNALVVASTGGHLEQAVRWSRRLGLRSDSVFVTFDGPQSRSLLAGLPHRFVPYVNPRDALGVVRTAQLLMRFPETRRCDVILSTGAGVALSSVAPAALYRKPLIYIESVSRFDGPSTTGRILERVPGVRRGTQHRAWASSRWPYVGSLLDDYQCVSSKPEDGQSLGRNIFVTLGTIRPYRFDRLIDRVLEIRSAQDHIVWQVGATTRDDLPGEVVTVMDASEFSRQCRSADVVVTHAGVGALLELMGMGISPIVVPRAAKHGEHVDDHQFQVARFLHKRGLVTSVAVGELSPALICRPRPQVVNHPGESGDLLV
jgi:UDP-N-acetylglucosamine--N-acetylmuramyl-(pentapeptide) pyrophosphoryl-undecaprenol N-acetylglucosamine transferase